MDGFKWVNGSNGLQEVKIRDADPDICGSSFV